jgi:hypothetical protein
VAAAARSADAAAATLKAEIASLKEKLPTLRLPANTSTHDTIREKEVRDELRELEPTRVFKLFREAIEDGDSLIFYAVVNASRVKPLLDAEHMEQGKKDYLRNRAPQAFTRLETATKLLDQLNTSGAQFLGEVEDFVHRSFNPQRKPITQSPFPLPHGA